MLDRTIPFYNTILRCDRYQGAEIALPKGFQLRFFQPGDEPAWANLEYETGDFASPAEAEAYFRSAYGKAAAELQRRCVFAVNQEGTIVGSCIAWRDSKAPSTVASLHWLVVSSAYQGKGLGKALCQRTMQIFQELGEFPVYLHTQPWSYKAILLYAKLGFQLQKTDTFSHYENQYALAMATLKGLLNEEQYTFLLSHSQ